MAGFVLAHTLVALTVKWLSYLAGGFMMLRACIFARPQYRRGKTLAGARIHFRPGDFNLR